ncbi:MAG: amidohydrolase [Bacillota bacterium]|nr:amidohydrolase [Bacillota bacterium]
MGKLWFGGTMYTLQDEGQTVEGMYTENGKIVAMGEISTLESVYKNKITERIDLQRNTLFPGFVDSHMHLIGHGEKLIRLDLSRFTSKKAVLNAVKEEAERLHEGEWLIGEGWNENLWEVPESIHRHEIDDIVPEHPVVLKRICRHAMIVNTQAMNTAGITETTACPTGGVIEKDANGTLSGLLKDKAQELLLTVIPEVSEEYLVRAIDASINDLYSLGLTGAHTEDLHYYGGFERTFKAFKSVIEETGMKFRAHLLVHHEVIDDMVCTGGSFLAGNEWLEFGAMKIFADGALGGRTALLSEPYHDDPTTTGVAIFSQEKLNELVAKAREHEIPVAVHAIGDLAFELILNAIERHPLKGNGRDRLIHAQILREDLLERANKLPLILDIQPRFLASDYPWVIDRIGLERMEYCYAWKSLINAGMHCAGGSDAPIEPADPLLGIHAAVTRTNPEDPAKKVYQPEQVLTVYEAISLFTKGSAFAASHEEDRGVLKEGFLADFTIFDRDLMKIPAAEILEARAVMTVIGEEIVYSNLAE